MDSAQIKTKTRIARKPRRGSGKGSKDSRVRQTNAAANSELRQSSAVLRVIQNDFKLSSGSQSTQTNSLQAKSSLVAVSQPDDPLEKQADRVADAVLRKGTNEKVKADNTEEIQRECTDCDDGAELQRQVIEEVEDESLQLKESRPRESSVDEEESLQRKPSELEEETIQRLCEDCEQELEDVQAASQPEGLQEGEESLQKKLTISEPDDRLEREADSVADEVVQTKAENVVGDLSAEPVEEELQRQCDECEQEAQLDRAATSAETKPSKTGLWQKIKSVFQRGRKIPSKVAKFFSERIGYDFSNVTIHTDEQAAQTAKDINARAYTYRDHVVFADNEFQPDSHQGRHLIAHELTHVVQQGAAAPIAQPQQQEVPAGQALAQAAGSHAAIQRDQDEGLGDRFLNGLSSVGNSIGSAIEGAVDTGADMIWSVVERVAPRPLMTLLREVQQKGFFGYIREKVSEATDSIFNGLSNQSAVLGTVFQVFTRLAGTTATIIAALAQGDCEPLFAALRQMRDMVTELAGDAWQGITDFFQPIGEFFSNLWQRFGAPVVTWLQEVAGETWTFISGLGNQIWEWTRPVVSAIQTFVGDAWSWMKEQLGISSGAGGNEGGLSQWIQEQAQSAWNAIKSQLAPVIEPVQAVVQKVQEVLPLTAIMNFRETANGWLQQVAATARSMDRGEGGDVAENQDTLRSILPAMLSSIQGFQGTLVSVGVWIAEKIGSLVSVGQQFIGAIARSPLVSGLSSVFQWLGNGLTQLSNWVQTGVRALFGAVGQALVWLSQFIEPVLNALRRILDVVGDLLGRLPDFLMGPLWWILPDCIKNPVKNFFVEQILSRIPLFQQIREAGDIWQRVQATAISILRQIFVDGDLFGAAWRFFREMLALIGIPAQLVVSIIANAAQSISDIIMNPIGFLGNLLRSMWQGATQFFGNILSHLFGGVTGWLFGQIEEAGLTPPDITSFRSIIGFVFELLGLTLDNIWRILAEHIGRPLVERIQSAIEFATGAWAFLQVAINEGLAGIWAMIQERLSNLWNLVLGSVAGWINTAIISTASRWLLSLLDATGITPIINSLIAIYRAIESFAHYLVEMLQIVNSVVSGLADIARGRIQSAADYLETTMAQSLPIVIGFLANQFGLGTLGARVRELVESLRERVNAALSWLVGNALRLGRSFIDMVRSGVSAVRNWWENRHAFRDSQGHQHSLYFQSERGELIVASEPTPVGRFLTQLVISPEDPQKTQKENHKRQAQAKLDEINQVKQDLARQRQGADTSTLQNQLNQKMDELATHLTPLLAGAGDTSGRLPNPLTLASLDDAPVTTPRSPEEEQIDLNGARQIILLAAESADGSEALSGYFDRVRTRFALSEVAFHASGENYAVKLRASRELSVSVNVAYRGTTPGISIRSQVAHNTGTAAGDTVGISMEADPLGQDKINDGSEPRASALRGVMGNLVTNPSRRSASKYIKGHLLNHNIGGPGDNTNMYPITGAANSAHHSRVEHRVKGWVDRRYWIAYQVRVRNITESITHPNAKHPENYINATFQCNAHIKNLDGSEREAFSDSIVSTYSRQDVEGDESIEQTEPLSLDSGIRQALGALSSGSRTASAISEAVGRYAASSGAAVGLGSERINVMLQAYAEAGDLSAWSGARRSSLTYINNRAATIRTILTSPVTTD